MTALQERPSGERIALQVTGVTKRFGTTIALSDVSMRVAEGDVRAFIGRNGAGKSTLIAAITGILPIDAGEIAFPALQGTQLTRSERVACVYQKSSLVPHLSAAENIVLGAYPTTKFGLMDWKAARAHARSLLEEWGAASIADELVERLDPLQRKIIEVCRALGTGARILLLDEPTAGLDGAATRTLFARMEQLTSQGITILYVSHYLEEIFEVCRSVTVIRDGQVVMTDSLDGLTMEDLVAAMVGDDAAEPNLVRSVVDDEFLAAEPLLSVSGLSVAGVEDFSVDIRPGECVGLVGLEGSGIFEVAECLAGLRAPTAGQVQVRGKRVPGGNVLRAIKAGIGYLPEDRHISGFVPEMANEENATLSVLHRLLTRVGLVNARRRKAAYAELSDAWEIKQASFSQSTRELSGGNQQKVALARAFASAPDVLVLANPTAGVDVSAKASIVESIAERVANDKTACLIVSTDESEFLPCRRVVPIYRGRIAGELTAPWTEHEMATAVQGGLARSDQE